MIQTILVSCKRLFLLELIDLSYVIRLFILTGVTALAYWDSHTQLIDVCVNLPENVLSESINAIKISTMFRIKVFATKKTTSGNKFA